MKNILTMEDFIVESKKYDNLSVKLSIMLAKLGYVGIESNYDGLMFTSPNYEHSTKFDKHEKILRNLISDLDFDESEFSICNRAIAFPISDNKIFKKI